ncbi:hypothetical protein BJX68DRAFT_147372 [Aspergillus pseudodeflectus]|uniref:Uncharacterized protein n=1 Tax=Aspergillus pseudodeflectus TaxID=176178 RepID=A0ABR4JX81_9EURO
MYNRMWFFLPAFPIPIRLSHKIHSHLCDSEFKTIEFYSVTHFLTFFLMYTISTVRRSWTGAKSDQGRDQEQETTVPSKSLLFLPRFGLSFACT